MNFCTGSDSEAWAERAFDVLGQLLGTGGNDGNGSAFSVVVGAGFTTGAIGFAAGARLVFGSVEAWLELASAAGAVWRAAELDGRALLAIWLLPSGISGSPRDAA
ncbi:hypothetical protein CGQ24_15110 [Arthrobacter sp. 7749]|nr:hypothetical protein CGQ24_15110 [Arthrobacter sp. 7749]